MRPLALAEVTQQEIEALLAIENQIRQLKRMRDRRCGDILQRLRAGATVECGVHSAELEEIHRGRTYSVRLTIY